MKMKLMPCLLLLLLTGCDQELYCINGKVMKKIGNLYIESYSRRTLSCANVEATKP